MIKQDAVSKLLIIVAMMLSVFLATFETTALVMFPGFLLTVGLIMEWYLERKREHTDEHISDVKSWKHIIFWTLIALMGVTMIAFLVDYNTLFISLLGITAIAYGGLMAVSEEQFFRGFITDFMQTRFKNKWISILVSAGIFTMYHLARYRSQPDSMLYVFGGGFILSFVAIESKRISPCMLAHVINNVLVAIGWGFQIGGIST